VNHLNKYGNNVNQVEIVRERVSPEGGKAVNGISPAGRPLMLFGGCHLVSLLFELHQSQPSFFPFLLFRKQVTAGEI